MVDRTRPPTIKVIDPELARALRKAPPGSTVQAVFSLRRATDRTLRRNSSTRDVVTKLVREATRATHSAPKRVTVFSNLQAFAVAGPPELLRAIMARDEVISATANIQQEDLLIRPIERKRHADPPARRRGGSG